MKRFLKGIGGGHLAVDTSNSSHKGRLYFAWQDVAEERFQIVLASSSDGGKTWSKPLQVNDNKSASNQSNVGIAVNAQGTVGIVWNDRRDDPSDNCFRPYFTASFDGGKSFLTNQKVSEDAGCTVTPDGKPAPERYPNGGETFGMVACHGPFSSLINESNWPFTSLSFACAACSSVSRAVSRLRKRSSS